MRPVVALMAVASFGVTLCAAPAHGAEPYDGQLAAILVTPADASLAEVLDPAARAHSGALDQEVMAAATWDISSDVWAAMRGGYARVFAAPDRTLTELGIDEGVAGTALAKLGIVATSAPGRPVTVDGVAAASQVEGVSAEGVPYASITFQVATRFLYVGVAGPDPDHALLRTQAARVASAANRAPTDADAATAGKLAALANASAAAGAPSPPATDLRGRVDELLGDRRTTRALAVIAGLLILVLTNRVLVRRRARRAKALAATRPAGMARPGQSGWSVGSSSWPTVGGSGPWSASAAGVPAWPVDTAPFPTMAAVAPTRAGAGPHASEATGGGIDVYFGNREQVGWGDEPEADDVLPPLPSRASTPRRGGVSALAAASLLAPTPLASPPAPLAPMAPPLPGPPSRAAEPEDEVYSFPGAETWPEDLGGTATIDGAGRRGRGLPPPLQRFAPPSPSPAPRT